MKAFGTFTKIGNNIYRTDTYLQFGDKIDKDKDLIGACVLCNPGSAEAFDKSKENELLNFNGPGILKLEKVCLEVDPTMEQLQAILEGIYGSNLKGIFRIYNLFTLRNPKMTEAIKCIKEGNVDTSMIYKDFDDFMIYQLENRFKDKLILKAWGVDDTKLLRELKCKWDKSIDEISVRTFEKFKELSESQYYHPLPRLHKDRKAFVEYIINQYNSEVATS